jgi:hypothetical protein
VIREERRAGGGKGVLYEDRLFFLHVLILLGAGQSLYTKFENREIMFHVGTMILPDGEPEKQRVERKRHIGSDTINIVFKDPGCKLNVTAYTSHLTRMTLKGAV